MHDYDVYYPFPSVEDVMARVGDASIFSKLDLESAYLQLPLDESEEMNLQSILQKDCSNLIICWSVFQAHPASSGHF